MYCCVMVTKMLLTRFPDSDRMEVEALALDETPILLTNNEAFALEPVLTTCKHSSYIYSLS